ncbi:MAG TPA: hypothetical protein DCG72_03690, partial [Gammaproteobacteria bacterium]|nr:hypothetical protein [Gammaproteobacteria bacterium]
MAAAIGALRVTLGMNSAAFEKGTKKAGRSLDNLERKFKAIAVAAAAAMTAAAAAISTAVVKVANDIDKLGKTAERLGLTTKELQELRYAAELSGVPIATLETSMQRFARRLGEAAKGEGVLKDVIKRTNIKLRDQNGKMRSVIDIFRDYADVVQKTGSQQEKLLLLIKAFDTEGGKMFEILKNGSAGL